MIWTVYAVGVAFILGAAMGSGGFYLFLKASTFTQMDNRLEMYAIQDRLAEIELNYEVEHGEQPHVH